MKNQFTAFLQNGIGKAIEAASKHLTTETRAEILGDLAHYVKSGTGQSLLSLACFNDGLQMILGSIVIDGVTSEEEYALTEDFLRAAARLLAKFRPEYRCFAEIQPGKLGEFVQYYWTDEGPFGFRNQLTQFAGIKMCQRIASLYGDFIPIDAMQVTLVSAAEQVIGADGITDDEEEFLCNLKRGLGVSTHDLAMVHYVRFDPRQLVDPSGTIINSIGMKLVPISAGEFMMGGREGEEGYSAEEERLHRIRITRPFLIGMFQVTQCEYATVTGKNPSRFHGKTRPVERVSWQEATEFCRKLSERPAEKSAGRSYRLPSEAEWEYACRAGTSTSFGFGDTISELQVNFCKNWTTAQQPTYPVGMFPPNNWGLFDMHGNVWEWCSDWYGLAYYSESPSDNPKGPKTGTHHVLRGGSASVQAHECRSAVRGEAQSDRPDPQSSHRFEALGDFGIRVVCEITQ
jgi:formylglycine-generating enzyme required for sulfatase activity